MNNNRVVVIYGAGSVARQLLGSELAPEDYVLMTTAGDEKNLVQCIDYLDDNKVDEIIIASQFVKEIKSALDGKNIKDTQVSIFEPSLNRILTWLQYAQKIDKSKVLHAYYDLEVNPVSFDVSVFAAKAILYAESRNLTQIHYVIVMSSFLFGRVGDSNYYLNQEEIYHWKLQNLLCSILASTKYFIGFSIEWDRESCQVQKDSFIENNYPENYSTKSPERQFDIVELQQKFEESYLHDFNIFRRNRLSERALKQWLHDNNIGARFICITLREYENCVERNNDVLSWSLFIESIKKQGFDVVLIRDTFSLDKPLPNCLKSVPIYEAASWSIPSRIAIYRRARLNMSCNTGPVSLMYFMGQAVNFLVFKLCPDVNWVTSPAFFKEKMGLELGQRRLFFSTGKVQDLVWESDSLDTLLFEFNKAREILQL